MIKVNTVPRPQSEASVLSAGLLVGIYAPKIRPLSRLTIIREDGAPSSNNNQRRVMPRRQKAGGNGGEEREDCWKTRLDETNAKERASQIETNGDLYASQRIPQFYCRLISSPANDNVLLLLLRRYGLSPLLSLLPQELFRIAPKETDMESIERATKERVQARLTTFVRYYWCRAQWRIDPLE